MQTYEKVTLYRKLYSLTKYNYMMVKNFPKEYKFTLGGDICFLSWQCLDLVLEANAAPNNRKQEKISVLSTSFDKLKLRVRLAQEIGLISLKQFSHIQENYLIEIGNMIGGFLKWSKDQREVV
jgi:hypothetical protein